MAAKPPEHDRPWVRNYPDGIDWDIAIDTTPVHERVLAACDGHADAIALDFLGATTTFGELGARIRAFAGALQSEYGVKKGTRVALLLPNTPFYPIAYYAVLMCGGTVVNCNPLYTHEELAHIVGNAGADLLVSLDLKLVFEKAEALTADGHVKSMIICRFSEALPSIKRLLFSIAKRGDIADISNSGQAGKIRGFSDLIALGKTPAAVEIDAVTDVAVQQYTGGTTGRPKGAMLSHANIAANVSQIDSWGCGIFYPPSKVIAVIPFFHIFAMTVCMNVPLANGTQVVMLPRFELKALLDVITRTKANILPAVPTLLHAVASSRQTSPAQIASLEVAISGGAPLSNATRQIFAQKSSALLAEGYGLTECSPVVACAALRVPSKPMSIGQPLPGTDVKFVDVDNPNKDVGAGERGELVVKGDQVMIGYYNNDEATETAFVDGWFRTGDVGYMDEDGYIFLVDRIKDLIICSGFNVYPRNIEEALARHPAVHEVNVIGVPDEYRGEAPVAFVKLTEGAEVTQSELKDYLGDHISKIEIPREIVFKDELPKTLVGKLSKNELRQEYAKTKEPSSEQV